jgi:hypothetical protein
MIYDNFSYTIVETKVKYFAVPILKIDERKSMFMMA